MSNAFLDYLHFQISVWCVRSVFFGGRLTVYHFGGCAANTCVDLCGRRCATQVVMGMYKRLMGSDHVFQVLRACYIWTDMQSCQGRPPYMTAVGKPVMDNGQVRKECCSSYTFWALSSLVYMSLSVCVSRTCLFNSSLVFKYWVSEENGNERQPIKPFKKHFLKLATYSEDS